MWYVSTALPKFVQDSMSNLLPELLRYQSWLFELTTSMRVQKDGFQNREGWTLLEEGGTERSDVLREYRTSQVRSRFDVEFTP